MIKIVLKAFVPDEGGADVLSRWCDSASAKARARLDSRMRYLREQNREGWVREPYDNLRDGVGEVRFKAEGIWYRPLGFFGPSRNEFTFLFFATKTNEFSPRNSIDIAVSRKSLVEAIPSRAILVTRWDDK